MKYSALTKIRAWHGTDSIPFSSFSQKPGSVFTIFGEEPVLRTGFFFTTSFEKAQRFGKNVAEVLLFVKNPIDTRTNAFESVIETLQSKGWNPKWFMTRPVWEFFDGETGAELVSELKTLGYDSALIEEPDISGRGGLAYVVFSPTQIEIVNWVLGK